MRKTLLIIVLVFMTVVNFIACSFAAGIKFETNVDKNIYCKFNSEVLTIKLENNSSALAFYDKLKSGDVTVNMTDYGNFEKVGSLGFSLPTNDTQITTDAGDVILYQGDKITIYYDKNSWNFTKLGKVQGLTQTELKSKLGSGNIRAVFTINNADVSSENRNVKFDMITKNVKLNSGYYMPINGLGTWTLTGTTARNSVYAALKNGVRLIDTAQYYGNEKEVGMALRQAIDEKIVKREDVFITTKVMPSNYQNAKNSIDESLRNLQVDYIDLFLIHQPGSNDELVYKALEDGVKEKKIRSIGISNYYTKDAFDKVMSYATITPAVIQNENHIYYQNNDLRDYVDKWGVIIESWYPFGGRGHTNESLNNDVIVEVSKKYSKSPAQIILRWNLQSNFIAIPGSSNEAHIVENKSIYDFELSQGDMDRIQSINNNQRYENW